MARNDSGGRRYRHTTRWYNLQARWKKDIQAGRRDVVCALCGEGIDLNLPATHARAFTLDHIVDAVAAPSLAYNLSNLQSAHRACNSSKGNTDSRQRQRRAGKPKVNDPHRLVDVTLGGWGMNAYGEVIDDVKRELSRAR